MLQPAVSLVRTQSQLVWQQLPVPISLRCHGPGAAVGSIVAQRHRPCVVLVIVALRFDGGIAVVVTCTTLGNGFRTATPWMMMMRVAGFTATAPCA